MRVIAEVHHLRVLVEGRCRQLLDVAFLDDHSDGPHTVTGIAYVETVDAYAALLGARPDQILSLVAAPSGNCQRSELWHSSNIVSAEIAPTP